METGFLTGEHSSTLSLVQMWESSTPSYIFHEAKFLTGRWAEMVCLSRRCRGFAFIRVHRSASVLREAAVGVSVRPFLMHLLFLLKGSHTVSPLIYPRLSLPAGCS